jgi:hypothetical protein
MHAAGPIGASGASTTSHLPHLHGHGHQGGLATPGSTVGPVTLRIPVPKTAKRDASGAFLHRPRTQTISYLNDQLLVLPWTAISR